MKTSIVIPARYGSTRLPGKPLAAISGIQMIERVWRLAKQVKNIDEVIVATDDERIVKAVHGFGGQAKMTDPNCENGTERCFDVFKDVNDKPDIVINMQGDAPITPPWVIQSMVDALIKKDHWGIATPAVELSWDERADFIKSKEQTPASGTTVVFDPSYKALYFSKNVLPFMRDAKTGEDKSNTWRHIGLYGYRYSVLEQYLSLSESPLEKAEKLEQLRALENNIPVYVVPVDYQGRSHGSVDSPEDIKRIEQIIRNEGELV